MKSPNIDLYHFCEFKNKIWNLINYMSSFLNKIYIYSIDCIKILKFYLEWNKEVYIQFMYNNVNINVPIITTILKYISYFKLINNYYAQWGNIRKRLIYCVFYQSALVKPNILIHSLFQKTYLINHLTKIRLLKNLSKVAKKSSKWQWKLLLK